MTTAMKDLRHWLFGKLSDADGQTLVEYSLIIALISAVIVAAFTNFVGGANGLVTYVTDGVLEVLGSG